MIRVQRLHNAVIYEPKSSIGRFCGCRAERTRPSLKSIKRVENAGPDRGIGMLPPIVQFTMVYPDEPALCVQPQGVVVIEDQGVDPLTWQAIRDGHGTQLAIF